MSREVPVTDPLVVASRDAYVRDPAFHAQVEHTVVLLDEDYCTATGKRISNEMISVIRQAAALALVAERDVLRNQVDEAENDRDQWEEAMEVVRCFECGFIESGPSSCCRRCGSRDDPETIQIEIVG